MTRREPRSTHYARPEGRRRGREREAPPTRKLAAAEPALRGGARRPRDPARAGLRRSATPLAGRGAHVCIRVRGPVSGPDYKFQGAQRRAWVFWPRGPLAPEQVAAGWHASPGSRVNKGETPRAP